MNKHKRVGQGSANYINPYIDYIQQFKEISTMATECSQLDDGVVMIQLFLLTKGFKLVREYEDHPKTFSHKFYNLKLLL